MLGHMILDPPPGARSAPSTVRNRDPILTAIRPYLPMAGLVLEVAAGAGEHAAHFAAALPDLTWQPTDPDEASRLSIEAWRRAAGLSNLLPALALDAAAPETWPVQRAAAMVNINMIHISPWSATVGLMTGAGRVLSSGGVLLPLRALPGGRGRNRAQQPCLRRKSQEPQPGLGDQAARGCKGVGGGSWAGVGGAYRHAGQQPVAGVEGVPPIAKRGGEVASRSVVEGEAKARRFLLKRSSTASPTRLSAALPLHHPRYRSGRSLPPGL